MNENDFSFLGKQAIPIHTLHDLLKVSNTVKEIQIKIKESRLL